MDVNIVAFKIVQQSIGKVSKKKNQPAGCPRSRF